MGHPSSQFRGLAQCRSRHPSIHGLERKHTQVSTTHKVMFCEPLTSRVLRSSTHTGHTQNTSLNAQQQQLAMTGQPAGYRRAGGQGCEVRLWLTEGAGGVNAQHELLVLLPRRHRHAILTGTEACSTQPTLKQRSSIPSTLARIQHATCRGGIEGRGRTDKAVGFVGGAVRVVEQEEWLIRRGGWQPPEDAEAAAPATLLRPAGLAPQPAVLVRRRRDHLGAAVVIAPSPLSTVRDIF